ncbi:NAD(P)/FAD-dependent oxidoreductase [Nocardioides ferulae]|uniref:NAD(P)/FAD-dependent oxidoreductase n=1 Tax=Nocardioides ferulae TaxID=2340821 RepID=UPI001F0CAFD9|nr:FAD-dependent oxidoreductase [Nocardioides ferulae]
MSTRRHPVTMPRRTHPDEPPRQVAVVGGGVAGLSTAWFLQEHGVEVAVFEGDHVGAGASWGNAGWLTPALTTPLPEPAVLRYGLRTALRPSSPVYVPIRPDLRLWRFLAGFVRHCTGARWRAGMAAYAPINRLALDAFDQLVEAGAVPAPQPATPFLACYRTPRERETLVEELLAIRRSQPVDFELLTGEQARASEPALSAEVGAAIRLHQQRFVNPPQLVAALADSVRSRGAKLREGVRVSEVRDDGPSVLLTDALGGRHRFDAVVLATGAALGDLARPFGVRRLVQAGRGYSFSVRCRDLPRGPVYFPAQRVACTPLQTPQGPRLRVAGMMEFRAPGEPLDPRRIEAIVAAVRPLLDGAELDDRLDEWVGSRPCTADGLPLVGATASPRVFTAGGHGMWGVVLGPVSGRLLAEQVVTGRRPAELAAFDPMR